MKKVREVKSYLVLCRSYEEESHFEVEVASFLGIKQDNVECTKQYLSFEKYSNELTLGHFLCKIKMINYNQRKYEII